MINILKDRLLALRKERGLTQNEVSIFLGLPRGTYVHYELGKRAPDLDMLMRIADLYRVSLDFLSGYVKRRPDEIEWLIGHPGAINGRAIPASYRLSRGKKQDKASLLVAEDTAGTADKADDKHGKK